ncbi:type II toxin-antitoxin system RelE family toxin [Microcella sp.]|uniref:type II toxin-antitoxin system RelE family toxin n=1 Tax=Microcella sp. TaxID=1913979 RepID=UPI00255DFA37|nr:type II toxin-antitoxin system RelE/ParE family toxin [Microcella sp.]MBX9472427.1 type II toxin-antitoxin system RelE/ParE family toxin [Microcella sp.]
MTYSVEFTTSAARQVKKLPRPARERLLAAIQKLGDDPRPPGCTKLVGEEIAWRLRVGDYRIVYDVFDDVLTVLIVRAGNRREIYR